MKRIAFFVPHIGCPRRCSFCNQHSISGSQRPPTPKEVELELKKIAEMLKEDCSKTEIAFFGGSFTAIDDRLRKDFLETASIACSKYKFSGIRFSTRPDCINQEILETLKQYPINRIEIGAQSMNDQVLGLNNRGHSAEDTIKTARLIKNAGISLTLQMMTGLYGDSPKGALETASKLAELAPDEMRIYPTLVLKDTQLAEHYTSGKYTPMTLDNTIALAGELLNYFDSKDIRVIRLGLHNEKGLLDNVLAGPHHPALRELCEGYNLYKKAVGLLQNITNKSVILYTSPRDISKLVGHGGWLVKKLERTGYNINIKASNEVLEKQIRIC